MIFFSVSPFFCKKNINSSVYSVRHFQQFLTLSLVTPCLQEGSPHVWVDELDLAEVPREEEVEEEDSNDGDQREKEQEMTPTPEGRHHAGVGKEV